VRSVRSLRITLELVPGSDPIRGSVCGGATTRDFIGWMELTTALQAAIEEGQTQPREPAGGAATTACPDHPPED
jgi:hypothetical protein